MNRKMVFKTVGLMLIAEAALLLLPTAVALLYRESCAWTLLAAAAIALAAGWLLRRIRTDSEVIYAREGFVTVAMTWLALSAVGALPFFLSREIPSYVDAFFETVSGFTTTGASILTDVEAMSRGLLFWRSFTHWVGGIVYTIMTVKVSAMAMYGT